MTTRHSELVPQLPRQGSLHFRLMHARLKEHSLFVTHSGRQVGGIPIKSGKHEQDGDCPIMRHSEFGPHGDG